MSMHFCYCALNGDQFTAEEIARKIASFPPTQIFQFIMGLGGSIDAYSKSMSEIFPEHYQVMKKMCNNLRNGPPRNIGGLCDEM